MLKLFSRWQKARYWQLSVAILAMSILSLYVYTVLRLTDHMLFSVISGYQSTGNHELGVAIFFLTSSVYLYLIRHQDWRRAFPFFSTAVALFFPLVVLSSILRISIGLPESLHEFYANDFCNVGEYNELCGQALAHIVFCMTVRALPLVLTVPLLYRLLFDCFFQAPLVACDAK